MSTLNDNLNQILQEKENKIIPENIKKDVKIFNVVGTLEGGTDTSDADATAEDIIQDKTAYVNGQKITGTLSVSNPHFGCYSSSNITEGMGNLFPDTPNLVIQSSPLTKRIYIVKNSTPSMAVQHSTLAEAIGLTADKIKKDEVILGITGTYEGEGGGVNYENNNFEIIDNKYLKFKTINNNVNCTAETIPQLRIPDQMLGVFMNNKDSLIIYVYKTYRQGGSYDIEVITPSQPNDYLEVSCTSTSSSSFERKVGYQLGVHYYGPVCYAVRPSGDSEIDSVTDSGSDLEFNYYTWEYDSTTETVSNFRSYTSTSYQSLDVEEYYQALIVGGNSTVESNMYFGSYFTYYDYIQKPSSVDSKTITYKDITDHSIASMLLVDNKEIHLTSSQLSDSGTQISESESWSLTNPGGTSTTVFADPTVQPYVSSLGSGSGTTFTFRLVDDWFGLATYRNLPYTSGYKLFVDDVEWSGSVNFNLTLKIIAVHTDDTEYELQNQSLYSGNFWDEYSRSISGSNNPEFYWQYKCDHIKLAVEVKMNYRP